jgi:hypothetical protein
LFFGRSGDNCNLVSDEIGGVETNSKLSDHGNIGSGGKSFHEGLGSGFGDGTKIVDKFLLGHTDTSVPEGKGVVALIGDNLNSEIRFFVETSTFGVSDRFVSDFIESIRCIRNEFSKEHLFVRVKGVNDESHQLLDISIEGEVFFRHV